MVLFGSKREKVRGTVVLWGGKSISGVNRTLDTVNHITDGMNRFLDKGSEALGAKVSLQLISSTKYQSCNKQGRVGEKAYLEKWSTQMKSACGGDFVSLEVNFDWDEDMGIPGAFLIRNRHLRKIYLKSLTLENVPGQGRIHFDCNSWIYPSVRSKRIFFINKAYLPSKTPKPLSKYREDELINLRGDGTGERKKGERIYDYDVYNDLGDPHSSSANVRPILGGSSDYPYPRRGRTGRGGPSPRDGKYESGPSSFSLNSIYVPSNERFGPTKNVEFLANHMNAKFAHLDLSRCEEFDSFEDVLELYEILKHLKIDEESPPIPLPQLIQGDKFGWMLDEEFAREMLAGENPVAIRRLQEFPPSSKLDPTIYGDQNSKITKEHIMNSLDGLTVDEAIQQNKLYILDHHDSIIPFLRRINSLNTTKTYATRTLLFLKDDGTLKPLIIELSLPHHRGDQFGAISRVVLPAKGGVDDSIWQLAKAYVVVNDTGHHQLVSHWLNTHAVIEPFVIATNRQLSILHPIHKLLSPHFKDTMKINALARGSLINANGIIEKIHYPANYSMEMSSSAYKSWVFPLQALPADLVNRGVAIEDSGNFDHGVKLLIEDYPYAVDGLEIWAAIKTWVKEYCSFYYMDDEMIRGDEELQSWWKELREKGHEDKKDEPWWPKMQTVEELVDSCTIIIWIASALHAAVNFGQYSYGGFFPNRPSTSKRLLPKEGTPDYEELKLNPNKAFLKIISSQPKDNIFVVSIIAILSMHFSDEVYIGERSNEEWTSDKEPLEAFERFKRRLAEIEDMILKRNQDRKLKNRVGPVNMPYTLLFPTSTKGLTGKGIPNSISI